MGLDFRTAAALFMGSSDELGQALGLDRETLELYRRRPGRVPQSTLRRLADILEERGRAMVRVAEMLRDDAPGPGGNGATAE